MYSCQYFYLVEFPYTGVSLTTASFLDACTVMVYVSGGWVTYRLPSSLFDRMLWLNLLDNQGVCFLIDDARLGKVWQEREVKQKAEAAYKAMVEEFFDDEDYDENNKPLY